jgi:50S ribosomal subunit-associated GTPase HflX
VLAVVGTMKAGKSTTINAIVGTEILPNRNTPMTAIPTLIKHTQGQKRPRFIFSEKASQPINQLVQDLKEAFKDKNYQQELEQLKSDYDLYELVEKIRKGTKVVNQALDEHRVIKSLQVINDLVRIAPF